MEQMLSYFTNAERIGELLKVAGTLAGAIIIMAIGAYVAKVIRQLIIRTLERASFDSLLTKFVSSLIYYIIIVFVGLAAIKKMGVDTTSLIAILGSAGLAIGLALEGSLRNFAAGVVLIIFRPFKEGDYVEVHETMGLVEDIQLFSTLIITLDNETVILPNAEITGSKIINYSAKDYVDVEVKFWVKADADLDKVRDVSINAARALDIIKEKPAPQLQCLEFDEAGLKVQLEGACDPAVREHALFELTEALQRAFVKEKVVLSAPRRDIRQ